MWQSILCSKPTVFDFAKLAKVKLDPLASDYLGEGSDNEVPLHANRARFDDILIRPHFLIDDVSSIDTSTTLFGKQLSQAIYLSVTNGKNCFIPNGEQETALPPELPRSGILVRMDSPPQRSTRTTAAQSPGGPRAAKAL